jgi:hypothetical protein
LYRVALVRTDISENVSFPSSGFLRGIGFHSYVTVELLLLSLSIEGYSVWSKNTVHSDAFTAVSIIDAAWDYVLPTIPAERPPPVGEGSANFCR